MSTLFRLLTKQFILTVKMVLSIVIAAEGALAITLGTQTISLDKPVHFFAPDGSDILIDPGDYEVNAEAPGLRLISDLAQNKRSFLIDAIVADLDVESQEPVALAMLLREDEYHIILLTPGRKVHEAVGSSSGILTRGMVYKPLTAAQIKAALRTKRTSSQ